MLNYKYLLHNIEHQFKIQVHKRDHTKNTKTEDMHRMSSEPRAISSGPRAMITGQCPDHYLRSSAFNTHLTDIGNNSVCGVGLVNVALSENRLLFIQKIVANSII